MIPENIVGGKTLARDDLHLFVQGKNAHLHEELGAHLRHDRSRNGVRFGVWAPHAHAVSVVGDFNHWQPEANPMEKEDEFGIWTAFIPGVRESAAYKYLVFPPGGSPPRYKADPLGFYHERSPNMASLVWDLHYEWKDDQWLANRQERNALDRPI